MSMNKPDPSMLKRELERDLRRGILTKEMTEVRLKAALSRMEIAIRKRSGLEFMWVVENANRALHLIRNAQLLLKHDMYEEALEYTYTSGRSPVDGWRPIFSMADRERLRERGDPLPHAGPFTVYRGVAGHGRQRAVIHYSWTGTLDVARWFAGRASYGSGGLNDPAVFVVTAPASEVLFYTDGRNEDEYVLSTDILRPRRLERVTKEQFDEIQTRREEKRKSEEEVWIAAAKRANPRKRKED